MPLSLTDMIIRATDDSEKTKYEILAQLFKKRQAFDDKRLYPQMLEITEMYREMHNFDENKKIIIDGLKQKADITQFDFLDRIIEREDVTDNLRENIQAVLRLVDWVLPKIEEIYNIGTEILVKTAESIEIDWVNIISTYPDEGYFIISDADDLCVYSYKRIKYIADPNDPMYQLRTKPKILDSIATEPEQLKIDLLSARTDEERDANPNPATIFIDASVQYPFEETVFPVAKQSLLRWLRLQDEPINL